jgi:hypothetical protein
MARRPRKSTALPVKKNSITVISYIRELPGAVFFGDAINDVETIEYATRLQQIRREYENDDCQSALWHDLLEMGLTWKAISQFVTNPAAITDCGYGYPIPLR